MNIYQAVNYGLDVSGTIERPTCWGANADGTAIDTWFGSPEPSAEVLEAAWVASGEEQGGIDDNNKRMRKLRYFEEADPLFFKLQRGEIEQSVYDAKIAEIRKDLPLSTD